MERHSMRDVETTLKNKGIFLWDQPYIEGAPEEKDPDAVQKLDLFFPAEGGPFPLIVWIHGGGWHSGGKDAEGSRLARKFLPSGFALASISYRLTPQAPFPAQIEDCNAALAWLRKHALEFGLDARRVGVIGHSAGAHLCALMATTGGSSVFTKSEISERVQAAVCWSPPCDLDRMRGGWTPTMFPWNPDDPFCRTFFPDGVYDADFARRASPIDYVHGDVPPMLIVHGARDTVVPLGQALTFATLLRESGSPVTSRIEPECDHNVMGDGVEDEALQFFVRTLIDERVDSTAPTATKNC